MRGIRDRFHDKWRKFNTKFSKRYNVSSKDMFRLNILKLKFMGITNKYIFREKSNGQP